MSQKVSKGCIFYFDIANHPGMKKVIEMVEAQAWGHLFQPSMALLFEAEVTELYGSLLVTYGGAIPLANINGIDFTLNEGTLGKILEVPTEGVSTI
ncbi:hypothetical protein RND71_005485 [Anisodus tanguticus]|uniref:Uncharacterized protein n=1 Tax=Anisodus tanguticus TaxID=243964 RepID=A0AAE1SSI0_9SOLA|nr:hypothetical protein RND71_005485 [Anisodus tanguticus]